MEHNGWEPLDPDQPSDEGSGHELDQDAYETRPDHPLWFAAAPEQPGTYQSAPHAHHGPDVVDAEEPRKKLSAGKLVVVAAALLLAVSAGVVPGYVIGHHTSDDVASDQVENQGGDRASRGDGSSDSSTQRSSATSLMGKLEQVSPPSISIGGAGQDARSAEGAPVQEGKQLESGMQGVALIGTQLPGGGRGAGSGLIVSSGGTVVTNYHVVQGSSEVTVQDTTTGQKYQAKVVGHNASKDLAVLKLEGASGMKTIATGGKARLGQRVAAVGNGAGKGVAQQLDGRVTDLDKQVSTQAEDGIPGENLNGLIVTDADVVSGYSGGALMDEKGRVVGMTTAASSGKTSDEVEGYVVPISSALEEADKILAGRTGDGTIVGKAAALGITVAADSGDNVTYGLGPSGVVVNGLLKDSPLAGSGLQEGSSITAVNGEQTPDYTRLKQALAPLNPGDEVTVEWADQNGEQGSAKVKLMESSLN